MRDEPGDAMDRVILDSLSVAVLVVDEDVRIDDWNASAARLLGDRPEHVLRRRTGEVLHCIHTQEGPADCGTTPACATCPVRGAVQTAIREQVVQRRYARLVLQAEGRFRDVEVLVTAAPLKAPGNPRAVLAIDDISDAMGEPTLVTVCSYCGVMVRTGEAWITCEDLLTSRPGIRSSHGICPDCIEKTR